MSSTPSERVCPALEPPSGSKNDENVSVELRSFNQDRHDHSENETGREPWNADLLEKRTTQVFKVLQFLGLVTGCRSRRLANMLMLLIALIIWIPMINLSFCVAKDPIMSSPSGLPTILLFSGLSFSHHFGALYGKRHGERLRKNIYLAIERANFCRTCVMVFALFGILTISYLVLLVYLYVRQSILPVSWLQICVIYFLGYIYCASASVAMNLIFSSVCPAINIRINDFKREFKSWSEGLREALIKYQDLFDFMDREFEAIKGWLWLMSSALSPYGSSISIYGRSWHRMQVGQIWRGWCSITVRGRSLFQRPNCCFLMDSSSAVKCSSPALSSSSLCPPVLGCHGNGAMWQVPWLGQLHTPTVRR